MAQDDPFADIGVRRETDPFADIGAAAPAAARPSALGDVLQQIPSGLVAGTEGLVTGPAQLANLAPQSWREPMPSPVPGGVREALSSASDYLGQLYRSGLQKLPGVGSYFEPSTEPIPPAGARGIAGWLPEPQTTSGRLTRAGMEFVPSMVAATRGPLVGKFLAEDVPRYFATKTAPTQLPAAVTRGGGVSAPSAAVAGATTGALSEAAGEATAGTPYELPARVGTSLLGGTVSLRAAESAAARRAVPSIERLESRAGDLYDQFRKSGFELYPNAATDFSDVAKRELTTRGLFDVPNGAQGTWAILDKITPQLT